MAVRQCPTCQQNTPEGHFCVRCGGPLDRGLEHARERSQFAAAPAQRWYAPWLVSTLFPHLPRHSERHFHAAIAVGAGLVIVLGILRLFPIALISAATLMPLLAILYFYDVDVYENEPGWATALTLAWGALSGVGVGLLSRAIESGGTSVLDRSSSGLVFSGGILIPPIGVLAMLAGPLVLLRFRHFNDTLDGATFGAATAAMFAAAEAIVVGVGVLSGGLRPAGAAAPWVARLVGIAIATPVLSMGAVGSAAAAIWLRYRAPATDRTALGWTGRPVPAVGLAALLVIAGAVAETFMAAGLWLAWVIVLDLVALVLLRRALHVGLLEESEEIEIEAEIRCANCAAMTARHTFCGNCGIALNALPKVGAGAAQDGQRGTSSGRLAGEATGRGSGRRRLGAAAAAIAATTGLAAAAVAIAAPATRKPPCAPDKPCGAPPILGHPRAVFAGYTAWQSAAYGYSLRYGANDWRTAAHSASDLSLQNGDGVSTISFHAAPSSQASPRQLIDRKLSTLGGQMLGLAADTDPSDRLLGTGVGSRPGPGTTYVATTSTPQGPNTPVAIAIMAATDGNVTILVTVTAPANASDQKQRVYGLADDIINSVQWRGS